MSNANDMAFPVLDVQQTPNGTFQLGLTKRELFAAMAMQSALTGAKAASEAALPFLFGKVAQYSVGVADALLAELAK